MHGSPGAVLVNQKPDARWTSPPALASAAAASSITMPPAGDEQPRERVAAVQTWLATTRTEGIETTCAGAS
jgi:hypothetical protein